MKQAKLCTKQIVSQVPIPSLSLLLSNFALTCASAPYVPFFYSTLLSLAVYFLNQTKVEYAETGSV